MLGSDKIGLRATAQRPTDKRLSSCRVLAKTCQVAVVSTRASGRVRHVNPINLAIRVETMAVMIGE